MEKKNLVPDVVYTWLAARMDARMEQGGKEDFTSHVLTVMGGNRIGTAREILAWFNEQLDWVRDMDTHKEFAPNATIDQTLLDDLRIIQALEEGGRDGLNALFKRSLIECYKVVNSDEQPHARLHAFSHWIAMLTRVIHVCPSVTMSMKVTTKDRDGTIPLPWSAVQMPPLIMTGGVSISFVALGEHTQEGVTQIPMQANYAPVMVEVWSMFDIEFLAPDSWQFGGKDLGWEFESPVNYYLTFRGFKPMSEFELPLLVKGWEWERYKDWFYVTGPGNSLDKRVKSHDGLLTTIERGYVYDTKNLHLSKLRGPLCWPGISSHPLALALPKFSHHREVVTMEGSSSCFEIIEVDQIVAELATIPV